MKGVVLVCGHGPGISDAVARRFGKEGFAVAIVARTGDRLVKRAAELEAQGIRAKGFACDLSDPAAIAKTAGEVRAALGPISVLHWNAYAGGAGDLLTADLAELGQVFDVCVRGLVAAVQATLPDLEAQKGAVLVTGGGLGLDSPEVNATAVSWGSAGLAIGKAAQHKVAGLLHAALGPRGIYVGEVIVTQLVKGTAWDRGSATLEADTVAAHFWDLQAARKDTVVTL